MPTPRLTPLLHLNNCISIQTLEGGREQAGKPRPRPPEATLRAARHEYAVGRSVVLRAAERARAPRGAAFTGLACPPPVAAFASWWRSGWFPLWRLARGAWEPGIGLCGSIDVHQALGAPPVALGSIQGLESGHGLGGRHLDSAPPPVGLEDPVRFQAAGVFAFWAGRPLIRTVAHPTSRANSGLNSFPAHFGARANFPLMSESVLGIN